MNPPADSVGLNELLGIEIVSMTLERVEMTMPIGENALQFFGFLHGGATLTLLEAAASQGAMNRTDLEKELPFGVDVHVRHRKSGKQGMVRAVAQLDRTQGNAQFWNVAAYDEAGDVLSDGVVVTKIVSLEYLAEKERHRQSNQEKTDSRPVSGA